MIVRISSCILLDKCGVMNVLLWYQAFMEEGLIADQPPGLGKGLTVGPVHSKHIPRTLGEHSADVLCSGIFRRVRHASLEEREAVRRWLADLPSVTRTGLMDMIYQHKRTRNLWFKEQSIKQQDFTR